MRTVDPPPQHGALGPAIKPTKAEPKQPPDTWIPCANSAVHEKHSRTGEVRLKPRFQP